MFEFIATCKVIYTLYQQPNKQGVTGTNSLSLLLPIKKKEKAYHQTDLLCLTHTHTHTKHIRIIPVQCVYIYTGHPLTNPRFTGVRLGGGGFFSFSFLLCSEEWGRPLLSWRIVDLTSCCVLLSNKLFFFFFLVGAGGGGREK